MPMAAPSVTTAVLTSCGLHFVLTLSGGSVIRPVAAGNQKKAAVWFFRTTLHKHHKYALCEYNVMNVIIACSARAPFARLVIPSSRLHGAFERVEGYKRLSSAWRKATSPPSAGRCERKQINAPLAACASEARPVAQDFPSSHASRENTREQEKLDRSF